MTFRRSSSRSSGCEASSSSAGVAWSFRRGMAASSMAIERAGIPTMRRLACPESGARRVVAVEVALDRVTDPSWSFRTCVTRSGRSIQTSTWIPSVAATVAIDPDPAAPQERGLDGRLGLDVESLWRWRDHRVGLYLDAVMGLGPNWAARHRLHGGVLATWFERQWRLNLRLETRRSPDGLPAGPYDNLYALFRHEQHFVRPPASDARFGANVTLRHVDGGHGLTLRRLKRPVWR